MVRFLWSIIFLNHSLYLYHCALICFWLLVRFSFFFLLWHIPLIPSHSFISMPKGSDLCCHACLSIRVVRGSVSTTHTPLPLFFLTFIYSLERLLDKQTPYLWTLKEEIKVYIKLDPLLRHEFLCSDKLLVLYIFSFISIIQLPCYLLSACVKIEYFPRLSCDQSACLVTKAFEIMDDSWQAWLGLKILSVWHLTHLVQATEQSQHQIQAIYQRPRWAPSGGLDLIV